MRARIFSLNFEIIFSPDGFRNRRGGGFEVPTIWVMTTSAFPERPGQLHHLGDRIAVFVRLRTGGQRRGKHGAHDKAKDFFSSVWGLG